MKVSWILISFSFVAEICWKSETGKDQERRGDRYRKKRRKIKEKMEKGKDSTVVEFIIQDSNE